MTKEPTSHSPMTARRWRGIAAAVEPARMIHEEDIIRESENSMSYRAGLQARELIEEKLKSGQIRGLVSTSALEMGIDIPELTVGMNLGIPTSIKRMRQRAGRVGRRTPGRFIVMDDEYAFQFDEGGLKGYWERTVEPARLYLNNRFLHQIHARCLQSELDQKDIIPDMQWPEGFQAIAESLERGESHSPDFQTLTGQDAPLEKQYPHDHDLRSFAEKQFDILVRGDSRPITSMTKTEAMRELYTWALYHHAKQAYQVVAWNEDGTPENDTPHVIMLLAQEKNRTSRIMDTGATIDLEKAERTETETGILAYANSSCATGIETIVGCTRLENQDGSRKKWVEYRYSEHRDTPNIVRTAPTTLTLIQIKEDWFRDTDTREQLVTALRDIMCHLDNVNSGDLMVAHENIRTAPDEGEPRQDCIALWDRAYGGTGVGPDTSPEPAGLRPTVAGDHREPRADSGRNAPAEARNRPPVLRMGRKHGERGREARRGPRGNSPHQDPLQGCHISEPTRGQVGRVVRLEANWVGIRTRPDGQLGTRLQDSDRGRRKSTWRSSRWTNSRQMSRRRSTSQTGRDEQ